MLVFINHILSFIIIKGLPDDVWTPYKQLQKIVGSHLSGQSTDHSNLEATLRKYKQNFVNLLKNSVCFTEPNIIDFITFVNTFSQKMQNAVTKYVKE